jgi:hypothetical protein
MDFSWTKEQEALKEHAIAFAQQANRPDIDELDRHSMHRGFLKPKAIR